MRSSKEYKLAIKIAGEMEKSFYNSTRLTKKELAVDCTTGKCHIRHIFRVIRKRFETGRAGV